MKTFNFSRQLSISLASLLFLIHFILNFYLFLFNPEGNIIWSIFDYTFIVLFSFLTAISYANQKEKKFVSVSKFGETFLRTTKTLFNVTLIFLGINVLFKIINAIYSFGLINILELEINFIFTITISYLFFETSLNWLNQLKSPNFQKFVKLLNAFLIPYFILLLVAKPVKSSNSDLFGFDPKILLILGFALLFLLAFKVKIWLPLSPRNVQKSLVWYSLIMILALLVILDFDPGTSSGLYNSVLFFNEIAKLFAFSMLITYSRVLYFSLISLPFSNLLARKVYEVDSLFFLNRIVRNFNNLERIYEVFTEITSNTFNQSPTWIQFYENDKIVIKWFIKIEKQTLENLIYNQFTDNFFQSIKQPTFFTQSSEILTQKDKYTVQPLFESFCIVPIIVQGKIIGHFVTANQNPYYFDEDDLKILTTYVETLCISIEGNNLLKETIEKEKYKQELLLGKKIQYNFLPTDIPVFPNLEIEVYFQPSEEVGGDFYDFIPIDNNKILFLIGDVSGKGISAAFYMALLKGVFLSYREKINNLSDFFKFVNKTIYKQIDRQMHVTMAGLLINFENNSFEFIRAGHLPALIKTKESIIQCYPSGLGISLVSNILFEKNLSTFANNLNNVEYFLLFTDGLIESLGNKDITQGLRILKEILEKNFFNNANELKNIILEHIEKLGTIFDDDITLIVIGHQLKR